MIRLNGDKLMQYDLNRTIEIIPRGNRVVRDVTFYKGREPYVVLHRDEDGNIIADIPNTLLRDHGTLTCVVDYTDEKGNDGREHQNFFVRKRAMPEGYEYTETNEAKLGSGGSLPTAAPYQQLVTDGEGKWGTAERLAWKEGEKVHPIPAEYLNGSLHFHVNVTYDADTSSYIADRTYDEIKEAEAQKKAIVGTFTNADGKVYTIIGCDAVQNALCYLVAFDVSEFNYLRYYKIAIIANGTVEVDTFSIASSLVTE